MASIKSRWRLKSTSALSRSRKCVNQRFGPDLTRSRSLRVPDASPVHYRC